MRFSSLAALLLAFCALILAVNAAGQPVLRLEIAAGTVSEALAGAQIEVGPQPWLLTFREATADEWSVSTLEQRGVRVRQGGVDCRLFELTLVPAWAGDSRTRIMMLAWLFNGCLLAALGLTAAAGGLGLVDWVRLLRTDAYAAIVTLGLQLLIALASVIVLALLGPSISNDYFGDLFAQPGCTGTVTLLANIIGIDPAGLLWLAPSAGCGLGAVAALAWRGWAARRSVLVQ